MFDWTEWKNTTAFFGADKENFTEGISLDKLLIEHTDTSVVVSSSGRDIHGCGSEREPCLSFWEGMRHFREGIQFREIKTNTSAAISDEWDLSNSSISSVVPSSPGYSSSSSSSDEPSSDECTIIVGKAIQSLSEPSEAALTNKLILTFTSINFCLPSFFETPQKELLFTETGTATLNKCSFAMQTAEEGIAFVLFHFISVGDAEEKGDEESSLSRNDIETKASKEESEIRLENLQWHLIRSTNAKASIISYESGLSVELTMENSTFSDCNSESLLGGAFCVWMKEKAGGLADSWANEGKSVAKDFHIVCRSIAEQINEALFVMDFCELAFDRDKAIFGIDNAHDDPIDLVLLIVFYKSERIFVPGENGKNEKDCGRRED
ncbi:uncharacterized protein MONOS_9186 [Monocercomonoides exilis]|uniref:uncharacterized protein n=1 Tax=Monocercomonoides exilis TaxID=2049356 RepID=UPI003559F1A7|nr:hypothetical protein MONOS_9186 [Monocercomonoides exilis]|eukprot:MONOS_9186.1-p1 / transcript=MONOS_9186.1 / gene=MONOS_9186 / organism=Monocercomonoides_exilis_PA203 / gene_product=unspecified product / transcript_product=unspecified product / location=Mono_scaffold00370:34559-36019(-) / protein_length=380 / sequence_SO=supercontig / SO=protein_coding / is_pseudo=false